LIPVSRSPKHNEDREKQTSYNSYKSNTENHPALKKTIHSANAPLNPKRKKGEVNRKIEKNPQ